MSNNRECIFCGHTRIEIDRISKYDGYKISCDNCGDYKITSEAFDDLPQLLERNHKRHLISGYIREMTELGLSVDLITTHNYESLLASSKLPNTVMEKLDKLLLFLYRNTTILSETVNIGCDEPAIAYAKNHEELHNVLKALCTEEYVSPPYVPPYVSMGSYPVALTLKGIERAEKLIKEGVNSKQCFVALWFDNSMMNILINISLKQSGTLDMRLFVFRRKSIMMIFAMK